MIQKVFLDTNVVIDLLMKRAPFAAEAEQIFGLTDTYDYEIVVSALTIANVAYAVDRLNLRPHDAVAALLPLVKIIDLSSAVIEETVVSVFKDFEDGLQHSSALAGRVDVIVTRNERHFKPSLIPVMSPPEFLQLFKTSDQ